MFKMKSFKSFRIDDILVNTSKSDTVSEKYSPNGTISEELSRTKTLLTENRELTRWDNEPMKLKRERDDFPPPIRDAHPTSELEVTRVQSSDMGGSRFAPFQLSQVPVENGGKFQPSYSNLLPYYSMDQALRISQNRSLLKHYAPNIFSFPTFSPFQRGHYSPNGVSDYAIPYPGLGGQYGIHIPNVTENIEGFSEKGPYPNEKGHYSMYALTRPMYTSSCKRKGGQIRFNNSQTGQLEKAFVHQKYLNATERKKLAHDLGLTDRQIKTWFQNRRAKLRKSKGGQCSDMEISGSPQDHHIDASSDYPDSPYDIQIAD